MAPKRQRTNKGKEKVGSSNTALEFPDEFSPQQGFNVRYWDRELEEVVNCHAENLGSSDWRKIYELREPCRNYMPCKYICPAALDYFGIRDGVWGLMESIGWSTLLTIAYFTNACMMHEFYAYLKVTKENRRGEKALFTRVEFKLGGFAFDYTDKEFARIFGFNPSDPSTERELIKSLGVSRAEFWMGVNQILFNQECNKYKKYKATSLVSRELKYIHRVLTHTVSARAESNGNVNKWEQLALYCMVTGQRFNGVQMLLDMMQRHTRDGFKGRACGGGLIMLLAVRHGFPSDGIPDNAVKDNVYVDTAAFSKIVYPPANIEREEEENEEEELPDIGDDHGGEFRDIPDEFDLSLVAQLSSLQNDIQRLDLNYQEEERRFEEYSIQYYHQRYNAMEQWNDMYEDGIRRTRGQANDDDS